MAHGAAQRPPAFRASAAPGTHMSSAGPPPAPSERRREAPKPATQPAPSGSGCCCTAERGSCISKASAPATGSECSADNTGPLPAGGAANRARRQQVATSPVCSTALSARSRRYNYQRCSNSWQHEPLGRYVRRDCFVLAACFHSPAAALWAKGQKASRHRSKVLSLLVDIAHNPARPVREGHRSQRRAVEVRAGVLQISELLTTAQASAPTLASRIT
jgi:hypothetical protein